MRIKASEAPQHDTLRRVNHGTLLLSSLLLRIFIEFKCSKQILIADVLE